MWTKNGLGFVSKKMRRVRIFFATVQKYRTGPIMSPIFFESNRYWLIYRPKTSKKWTIMEHFETERWRRLDILTTEFQGQIHSDSTPEKTLSNHSLFFLCLFSSWKKMKFRAYPHSTNDFWNCKMDWGLVFFKPSFGQY